MHYVVALSAAHDDTEWIERRSMQYFPEGVCCHARQYTQSGRPA